jgi:hypothetical protein
MPNLDEVYSPNTEDAENGKWFDLRPASKDTKALRVKIRSAHSRAARKEEIKLDKRYRVQYMSGNGVLDPDTADEREVLLLAKGILLGWENFQHNGKVLDFVFKNVTETLAAFPQLRRELLFMARLDDNFRADRTEGEREGVTKNS